MIEKLLGEHRACGARIKLLEVRIRQSDAEIDALKEARYENALRAKMPSGMPRGTDPSDPTAAVAARIADGETPDWMREALEKRERLTAEHAELKARADIVEALLAGLSERERYLFEIKEIERLSWRRTADQFEKRFGEAYSISGLRYVRTTALKKMLSLAQ